jgi:hypothetical protein
MHSELEMFITPPPATQFSFMQEILDDGEAAWSTLASTLWSTAAHLTRFAMSGKLGYFPGSRG